MSHGEVDVEHPDELWVSLDDFTDALSGESLFPESGLDLVEDLLMAWLGLVEDYAESARSVNDWHRIYITYHS